MKEIWPLLFLHHDHIHLHLQITTTIPGIQPNVRDFEGDTALSHACCCGSLAVAKLLVQKTPDAANTREDLKVSGGVVVGKEDLDPEVEAIQGEDAVMEDVTKDSALSHKVDMDHVPDVKSTALNGGTDINTGDLDGVTPLHKAIANNWGDIVDLLLEQPHLKVMLQHSRRHLKILEPR